MECDTIIVQEDCSCLLCAADISRGEEAVQDKEDGSIFCSDFHWAAYFDIDDAREAYKRDMEDDPTE